MPRMSSSITNYDGAIVMSPQVLVKPKSIEELQGILRDANKYPAPVRAMGSNHSLTPCMVSTGTIIDMSGLKAIVEIDEQAMTLTAQAGLQLVEASRVLRKKKLQFLLNIEIGNITLGSAACCQTKDALDGVELGQLNSYVTSIKWVSPSGTRSSSSTTTSTRWRS
jgi:FAD/FMN-containing dehydrogenase